LEKEKKEKALAEDLLQRNFK